MSNFDGAMPSFFDHNNEQHADDHHRRGTETRIRLLGVKHARHKQQTDDSQEHHIGPQLRQQQRCEHAKHRDYGNPRIYAKA
jgi:hypothetical protein